MLSSSVSCFPGRIVARPDLRGNGQDVFAFSYCEDVKTSPAYGVYKSSAALCRVYAIQFPLNITDPNSADN